MAARTALTEIAEEKLREVLPSFPRRDQALVLLGLHTGLRCRELLSITIDQVWDGCEVRAKLQVARRSLKGGSGVQRRAVRSRVIPIHPLVAVALKDYIQERLVEGPLDPGSPLFLSRQEGRALSPTQANRVVLTVIARAGLTDDGIWGTHSMRKTFARRIYENSQHDLNLTRVSLGHRYISTTQAYLGTDDEAAAAAILALGPKSASAANTVGAAA